MDFGALLFYVATVAIVFITYNILTWGLNIQFGYAGIPNFTYITFWAAGAYFTGVTLLGPSSTQPGVHYILGLNLPFPIALLAGGVASALLGLVIGAVVLGRLRSDYLAIVLFSSGFVIFDFVSSFQGLFNGLDGISGITPPYSDVLPLDQNSYLFFFIGLSGVVMLAMWWIANRIYSSGLGRAMRAVREDPDVAEAIGKSAFTIKLKALVIGSFFAGIAGALTIAYVTAMNTSAWTSSETFIVFAAMLLGGRANNVGSIVGAFLLPVLLVEGSRFLPQFSDNANLVPGLRVMLIAVVLWLVLWFRPQGLVPEKRPFYQLTLRRPKQERPLAS